MKKYILLSLFAALFSSVQAQSIYQELAEKGIEMAEENRLEEAEQYFQEALKVEPYNVKNALLFSNLGTVQRRMARYEDAIESYTLALNLLPYSIPVLLDRASLYIQAGETDKAFIDYCQVLDVDRENLEAYQMRAYIYLIRKDYKAARIDFNKVLQLDPSNYHARFGMATVHQDIKEYAQSLELLNALLMEYPEDAVLYVSRAGVEREMQQYEVALADLDRALELSPALVDAYLLRGDVLLSQDKKKGAREDFEKAIELGIHRADLQE